MAFKVPNFRNAFMGYNKVDVTDFLTRTESEMEIAESRQAAADKTIASMRTEIQGLTRRLETLTEDNCQLESANAQLRRDAFDDTKVDRDVHEKVLSENQTLKDKIEALENGSAELPELEAENARLRQQLAELQEKFDATQSLRQECENLRKEIAAAEEQRKTIQDALISAQRMSQIVLSEAREEADRVTAEAREEADRVTTEAQQTADQTLTEARQRNEALQASYDRMLMDTGKMKSELIELYRRHLALLSEIPGAGEVPVLEEEALEVVEE